MARLPETKYFKGASSMELPVPIREGDQLVGYEMKRTRLVPLLKRIPEYNVFLEASGFHFRTSEAELIASFIVNECVFPEGRLTGKPFVPEMWQWAIYLNMYCWFSDKNPEIRRFNEVFVYLPRKNGKLLDLNTPIPTTSGWKTMGTLEYTDYIFDTYGNPYNISVLHPTVESPESYDVTFSNGETVKACADHQWFINNGLVVNTKEMLDLDEKFVSPPRKVNHPSFLQQSTRVDIVSITPCDPVPMRCITVDSPTGTYLFGKTMLPTHNTTAFGAIPSLISLFVDPEKRSQNFCCAADTEQAALNFRHAAYMVEQNPRLLNRLVGGKVRHGIKFMEATTGRTLKVLSSIAETKHGLSPYYVGVDEVHAHPNSELIDVMSTGTAARDNPLIVYTTTADYDRPSTCNELYKRSKAVAVGMQSDPHLLPIIYEALPTEDWESPHIWKKANPNFGISINERYFTKEIAKVRNSPNMLNRFLRLHLNIRTSVETCWIFPHVFAGTNPTIPAIDQLTIEEIREYMERFSDWFSVVHTEEWKSSAIDIFIKEHRLYYTWFFRKVINLQDAPCFAGYDHTAVSDIASLALFFPQSNDILSFNWVPAESIERRSKEDQIPYQNWFRAGLIGHSPGATIDEDHILESMMGRDGEGIFTHFSDCRVVAFDNWGSTHILKQLENYGLTCRGYPQGYSGMNQPCRTFETLLEQKNVFHGGHPVLTWMNTNCTVSQDHNNHIRPDKKNSTDKIDGIVAMMMAMGAWMYDENTVLDSIPGMINPSQESN